MQGANSIAVQSNGNTVTAYTVTYYTDDKFTNETDNSTEARSFEISFKMYSEDVNGSQDIVVTYNSKVTEEMKPSKVKGDGEDNTVYLIWPKNVWKVESNYADASNNDYNRDEDKVTVFTYALEIVKYDKNNKELKLAGAEFKLTDANKNVLKEGLVTDDNGKTVTIEGLDQGTYYLIETKAPNGYVLDETPIEVIITGAKEDGELTGFLENDTDAIETWEVGNDKGFNLPKTGGAGTAIFTILGVVLMGGALLLVVRMRKANGVK